jgi:hypothetical protein
VPRLEVKGMTKVPEKQEGRRSSKSVGLAAVKSGSRTKKPEGEAGGDTDWIVTRGCGT